ncbi:formate/nitrite transporter family protein [Paracoccus laeviglucosivorans]|uniref:Formate/nitrite transporter FocA, FNT family n=1 Tax=Paracoccus laeviglucosivorans TaxID=1197861 RepID=A0A521BAT0_9RHOB|nr:formate/nitrite transporter family protein [Paracoccus laeviglucosivorans]SMO44179.1 Formate/nitrite transporter FocA, FNT family [Paracoccus laeviglucosivorans]
MSDETTRKLPQTEATPDEAKAIPADDLDERMPSKAATVHELLRREGERELSREVFALFWSALAGGITMSLSLVARGIISANLPEIELGHLIEAAGYTFGFIFAIAAGQQLFTENTVTPVVPVLREPSRAHIWQLLRLWGTVLVGNIIGCAIAAAVFVWMPIFTPEVDEKLLEISLHLMEKTPTAMFTGGIVSGWLIAIMVWAIYGLEASKLTLIFLATYLIAIGDFPHVVVGAIEVVYLLLLGQTTPGAAIGTFLIPVTLGNIVGGTAIFALVAHLEVRADEED